MSSLTPFYSKIQAGTHGLNIKGMTKRIAEGVYKFTFDAFVDEEDGSDGKKIAYLALTFAETDSEYDVGGIPKTLACLAGTVPKLSTPVP